MERRLCATHWVWGMAAFFLSFFYRRRTFEEEGQASRRISNASVTARLLLLGSNGRSVQTSPRGFLFSQLDFTKGEATAE
ncbi:hypothetical protein TNCV_823741 [Trichonephila clavipes]|nr:hypothetical protein TNCV_823741 [Trichonephila clavipes]